MSAMQRGRRPYLKPAIHARSLDHRVRLHEQLLRNRQADGLPGLQVDDELEFRGLLDRQVAGLRTLEYLVDIRGCPIVMFRVVLSVTHQSSGIRQKSAKYP